MNIVKLAKELYYWKVRIEQEVRCGNLANLPELKLLDKSIAQLKRDYKSGQILPKKAYPAAYRYYSKKFAGKTTMDKLWVLKISRDWRIVYTVVGNEVDIVSFILDSMNHTDYNRRFHF